jgi:hypothetical protein
VGRVLDTLRELKLDRRTLVLFTSDNGPWLVKGADAGSSGPLRGGKGSTWEGGVRVPTIAWWPGRIAPGSVCDAVAGTIDLLPTAVSLAGGAVPAEPAIDGRDLSPLLLGKTAQSPREAHYYFSGYQLQAVRQGPWKLAIAAQKDTMGRGADPDAGGSAPRLYNLDEEIGERTDVADQHPDVVARLRGLADKMNAEIGGDHPSARRPAGSVAEARLLYDPAEEAPGGRQKAAVKPADLASLKPGDAIAGAAAPGVAKKPFTVSCRVETGQRNAIVLAHGGAAVGYAIHVRDARVCFAVRTSAEAVTEISSDGLDGPTRIAASLAKDGTMTLVVGDRPAVTGKAPGLIPHQPQEDFCLGHDSQFPLASYAADAPFRGSITELAVR